MSCVFYVCVCCVFKQKTAYEVRISDWSSDVCSSDLAPQVFRLRQGGLDLLVLHQGSRQIGEHRLAVADRAVETPAVETVTHLLSPFIPGFAHEADCAAARQVSRSSGVGPARTGSRASSRSEEHTSELQSLMRTSYAV